MKTPPKPPTHEAQIIRNDVKRLIKKYGYDNVREAVSLERPRGKFSPVGKLHAWVHIEATRLRHKCSAKKASEILSLAGGLMKPTVGVSGGLGDLVTPVGHRFKKQDGTRRTITHPETLRNYHKVGEKILKSCDAATADAWRDFADALASRIGK